MVSPTTSRRNTGSFRALLVAVLLVQLASGSLITSSAAGSRLPHHRALAVERAAALSRTDELEKRLVVAPISMDVQNCEEQGAWHSFIHPPLLRLFKRRGGDDDEEDSDDYDDEKSSKKSSSKYDDEEDEDDEESSKSSRKASKTRSAWDDEETSTASWGSNGALPTVTPFGAPLSPQATPAAGQAAGVGGATWAVGEHKSQVLVAQLQKARQRAMDASRLAGSAAAGAAAAGGMAAYAAPAQMGWISPAAGDAFIPNQEVVLSWRQITDETPKLDLRLCVLSNAKDLQAAKTGTISEAGCGQSTKPEVTPSDSGDEGVWEIRFPAPRVQTADSFYVVLSLAPGSSSRKSSAAAPAANRKSSSRTASSWDSEPTGKSSSRKANKNSDDEDEEDSRSSKSSKNDDDDKKSSKKSKDDEDDEDWRRRSNAHLSDALFPRQSEWDQPEVAATDASAAGVAPAGPAMQQQDPALAGAATAAPQQQILSPAFVFAPTGTDLTAIQAPLALNTNDAALEGPEAASSKGSSRPFPLAAVIVPACVVGAALLVCLALCLYRRGSAGAARELSVRREEEARSRLNAKAEIDELKRATSVCANPLSMVNSLSSGRNSMRDINVAPASYDSLRKPAEAAHYDAYTAPRRSIAHDRFGPAPSLAPQHTAVPYTALPSELGLAARERERRLQQQRAAAYASELSYDTHSSLAGSNTIRGHPASRNAGAYEYRHVYSGGAYSDAGEPLLSRNGTLLSSASRNGGGVQIHPAHLRSPYASMTSYSASPLLPALPEKPAFPAALRPNGSSFATTWDAAPRRPALSAVLEGSPTNSLPNPFGSGGRGRGPASPSIYSPAPSSAATLAPRSTVGSRVYSHGAAEISSASGRRGGPAGTASEQSVAKAGEAADLYQKLRLALGSV